MTWIIEDFPLDDDGSVLFNLASEGIDLNKKRIIAFSCYASSETVAREIVEDLSSYGYDSRIFVDDGVDGVGNVSVYSNIFMRPDHALLLAEQERLNAILRFHKTSCDGWLTESSR